MIAAAGCVGSTNDKSFHEKYYGEQQKGTKLTAAIENLSSAVSMNGHGKIQLYNYDKVQLYTGEVVKQLDAFIVQLEQMQVSEKMQPIKQEYIAAQRDLRSAFVDYSSFAEYQKNGDFKKANATEVEIMRLYDEGNSHENNADRLYEQLYPSQPTATNTVAQLKGYSIRINYAGSWQGNYGDASGQQSISGYGDDEYSITSPQGPIVAVIQKFDGRSDTLTVEILKDGKVMKSGHTDSSYGVVSVAYNPGWLG